MIKFYVNRKPLSLGSFDVSLRRIAFISDLYRIFHDFINVYRPGVGADNPIAGRGGVVGGATNSLS